MSKFFIGFGSAFVAPIVKIYTSGAVDLTRFDFMVFIGQIIPLILMGVLVGIYALTINAGETNMKRLFINCISLPALLISLVGEADLSKLDASPLQITCKPVNKVSYGIYQTMSKLTKSQMKYYILSKEFKDQEKYLLIKGKKYYIEAETGVRPKTKKMIFNALTCKVVYGVKKVNR